MQVSQRLHHAGFCGVSGREVQNKTREALPQVSYSRHFLYEAGIEELVPLLCEFLL
jgi:hypothetical protein